MGGIRLIPSPQKGQRSFLGEILYPSKYFTADLFMISCAKRDDTGLQPSPLSILHHFESNHNIYIISNITKDIEMKLAKMVLLTCANVDN